MTADLALGARVVADGVAFRVWAPRAEAVTVEVAAQRIALAADGDGMFAGVAAGVGAGADYTLEFDRGPRRPDPVSRWQPAGVHGPSRVVDPAAFSWSDAGWRGRPLEAYVIYELHVGTFTPEGTFDAAIGELPRLVELGITAIELMPVAEFPGGRNWGYDGVHLFAPQSTYGGPDGLRRLIDACHAHGLAVVLDVVYNHLGPEGNYLRELGPFFTDRQTTPWGPAIDFAVPGVRRHFVTNAVAWFVEYHVDALRLDAIHGIFDDSPHHILAELMAAVEALELPREVHLIAESDLNDTRVIAPTASGGYGLSAQWSDDFHHAVRTRLTGDRRGYFADFGALEQVAKAIRHGFVYDGGYSAHRQRRHGTPSGELPGRQFVIYLQNHDQIANGSQGKRIAQVMDRASRRLAAALLFATPGLPMLFMGEDYDDPAPFLYFVSHGDPALVEAVRRGRREELGELADALGASADPQAEAAFLACKLDRSLATRGEHAECLALHRALIALRRELPALANLRKDLTRVAFDEDAGWMVIERRDPAAAGVVIAANLAAAPARVPVRGPRGRYRLALATAGELPVELELVGSRASELELPGRAAGIYVETTSGTP